MGYNTPKQTVSQFQLKGRYARQYLSFAGKSSKDFLLYLSGPGVYDSPAADVESTSVPGRNGDIITENARTGRRRYQNVDIKYKAFFFNGLPAKTAAVKAWLLSPIGYQKLQDTYDPDFFRMAVCKDALVFDVTAQKAAEMGLTFNCKPQRWSVDGQRSIRLESRATLKNPFAFPAQPIFKVYGDSGGELYGRKTKLGNTEWNPGTIAGVIANERHCGDVLARKTFTPNFLTHKSKKNNNDRTQYRQRDHHEAIVSREVYNAANHLRASRNYTRKNRPLPVLSVVDDGILRGYVPFDKDWTGFSAEEYREASESVMQEEQENNAEVMNRLNLSGYEVVRAQYFSTLQNPAMTISNGKLRFNTSCLKKFEDVEYVELLLNSVDRCVAIRPCEKGNPNAIHWGRLKEGRWCASTLGCRGLAKTLFDIMEWEEGLKYRFRGQFVEQGDNKLMLFELDEPEMIKIEEIVLPSKEEEAEGKTVKQMIYIFPPEWAGTFGQPITSIAQVGILQQEHYAGNWDVLRPAAEIKEMNTFTADGLNALLHEAEEIMEGWTDTNE